MKLRAEPGMVGRADLAQKNFLAELVEREITPRGKALSSPRVFSAEADPGLAEIEVADCDQTGGLKVLSDPVHVRKIVY